MNGKSRCKILKEIRKQIAERNDIEFITSECKYKGDCAGTCPKCESEVRYLEKELKKREAIGKTVIVAGLALAVTASAVGCTNEVQDNIEDAPKPSKDNYTDVDGFISTPQDFMGEPATIQLPSISYFLGLSQQERDEYISRYNRSDIRYDWSNDSAVYEDTLDTFYVNESGAVYIIKVAYDENGTAVSIEIKEDEVPGGVEIPMGAVPVE